VSFIALASTTNTTLLVLTAASRLIYGIARDGYFPRAFAKLGPRGRSPYAAALGAFAVAAVFALIADIGLVASVTDFAVFMIFLVVNASVVALRFKLPDRPRSIRVPLSVFRFPLIPPLAFALSCLLLASLDVEALGLGVLALALGLTAWLLKARKEGARHEAQLSG